MIYIAKEVLVCDSFSADHFEKEVTCNMTELSHILKSAKDTIFQVQFITKVKEQNVEETLSNISAKDI